MQYSYLWLPDPPETHFVYARKHYSFPTFKSIITANRNRHTFMLFGRQGD